MQSCLKGHDKDILGYTKDQRCAECSRLSVKKWHQTHREKSKLKSKLYYQAHKKESKDCSLRRIYGITLGEYNRMFSEQNGCCKICNIHQSNLNKVLMVDHDHVTGKVRGLLCSKCNLLIGQANDSPETLNAAIKYLANL